MKIMLNISTCVKHYRTSNEMIMAEFTEMKCKNFHFSSDSIYIGSGEKAG